MAVNYKTATGLNDILDPEHCKTTLIKGDIHGDKFCFEEKFS